MSLLVEISQFNDPFNGTTEVVLVEGTSVYDEFLNGIRIEVKGLADQVTADKKVVATDKATVTTLKGQTQTLKDQTQVLKTAVDVAKSAVDKSLADVQALDKEVHDHVVDVTALKDEATKQAGISTAQATKSTQEAAKAAASASTATTQANTAKTQADAAIKALNDFKANPSTTGDLNVGGVLKVKGVDIATIYESQTDADKKLADGKAYTDAELAKLRATDQATLDTLTKLNKELAEGETLIDGIQKAKVAKAGDTMTGTLKFGTANSVYDIESMSNDAGNVKRYLRKFRSGAPSTIWHETINDRLYVLSTGVTDTAPQFTISNGDSATFQYPVLTNSPQSTLANSLVRKDYADAIDAKNVSKAGDTMTGKLTVPSFVDNTTNIGKDVLTYVTLTGADDWTGPVGQSRMVKPDSVGGPAGNKGGYWNVLSRRDSAGGYAGIFIPYGNSENKNYIGTNETGTNAPIWAEIYTNLNKPKWEDVGGGGFFNIVTDHIQAKDKWVRAGGAATGFIPYASGTTGTSSIGTSSWWFKDSFVVNTNTKLVDFGNCTIKEVAGDLVFSV